MSEQGSHYTTSQRKVWREIGQVSSRVVWYMVYVWYTGLYDDGRSQKFGFSQIFPIATMMKDISVAGGNERVKGEKLNMIERDDHCWIWNAGTGPWNLAVDMTQLSPVSQLCPPYCDITP